jgi:anaerobic nitric oxide reductase transcription regulator
MTTCCRIDNKYVLTIKQRRCRIINMTPFDILLSIASDLTAALTARDRYLRLLESVKRVIPYDAASLMRVEGEDLSVIVSHGLKPDAAERRFRITEHPRLNAICSSPEPVRFPADSPLPDPFDGLLANDPEITQGIHACLGCPLYVQDKLLGVLTADAVEPDAFSGIDPMFLKALGALAAAEMHTTELIEALEQHAKRQGLIAHDLMQDVRRRQGQQIVGNSPLMESLRREIDVVAWSDFPVLVTGETGTGKELVVHAIHAGSKRRTEPLLYVNCAALPESLVDSELFGHVKGSFTGATADRSGKFEVADGGTLFLDEIGELPLAVQPKLLRALQQGEIQRVGADKTLKVNVRLLAATNRDLEKEVEAGRFRADLFHRLNVYPIRVPALRERKGDVPLLAGYFCDQIGRKLGLPPIHLTPDVLESLTHYAWPGNVRELENLISRAVLKAQAEQNGEPRIILRPSHLGMEFSQAETEMPVASTNQAPLLQADQTFRDAVEDFQRRLILSALERNQDNWSAAARELGMQRSNLHHLAKRLGLKG